MKNASENDTPNTPKNIASLDCSFAFKVVSSTKNYLTEEAKVVEMFKNHKIFHSFRQHAKKYGTILSYADIQLNSQTCTSSKIDVNGRYVSAKVPQKQKSQTFITAYSRYYAKPSVTRGGVYLSSLVPNPRQYGSEETSQR